ncbi:MAG: WG repeat-containing protein, partial [Clostridia bacterium]|nr:WG repeat-containing protein [Clostridia bacterium]
MKKVLCLTMAIAALSICCLTACKQSIADKQAYKEFNESKGEAALVKKDERSQQLYPAFVMKGTKKKWGYIGEDGKFVIEPSFDDALDFQEPGLARVRMDQKFGLIDKTGRLIVECEYADIREYGNGAVIASENWSN